MGIVLLLLGLLALFVLQQRTAGRVDALEAEVRELRGKPEKPPLTSHETLPAIPTAPQESVGPVASPSRPRMPDDGLGRTSAAEVSQPRPQETAVGTHPLWAWLQDNTLIKVGALIFFLGAVWFVSYAISQGWISPLARILLGVALGVGVWALGVWRRRYVASQYVILTILGSGIVFATVFAAQFAFLVPVLPTVLALGLLVGATTYTVVASVISQKEWLCALAGAAGLVAPLLVNDASVTLLPFYGYLFCLAAGLLTVVFFTRWRSVAVLFVLGTGWYQALHVANHPTDHGFLWLAVILFSGLYLTSVSVSLLRSDAPHPLDLTVLGVQSLAFLIFASELAQLPSAATFIAAAVIGSIGYGLHSAGAPTRTVSVYVGLATLYLLVGTSFLLDGFSLTIAYTLEVAFVALLAVSLRLTDRAVLLAHLLFLVPAATSLSSLTAPAWETSAWHPDALALYGLTLTLFCVAIWNITHSQDGAPAWYRTLAGWLLVAAWGYAVVVVGLMSHAWFGTVEHTFIAAAVVGWASITTCLWWLLQRLPVPAKWAVVALGSGVVPLTGSLGLVGSPAWADSVSHPAAWVLFAMTALTSAIAVWYLQVQLQERDTTSGRIAGITLGVAWVYAVFSIGLSVGALIDSAAVAGTVRYVAWALLSYVAIVVLFHVSVPVRFLHGALLTMVWPVFVSLGALLGGAWSSVLSVEAVGLYGLTTILLSLGITLARAVPTDGSEWASLRSWVAPLLLLAGLYAARVVWLTTHTVFSESDYAVTVALFIYTLAGLLCYSLGRARSQRVVKLVGIVLLTGVILRLLLVEVWLMGDFWRIITFMGIGGLFIITALLERPLASTPDTTVLSDDSPRTHGE